MPDSKHLLSVLLVAFGVLVSTPSFAASSTATQRAIERKHVRSSRRIPIEKSSSSTSSIKSIRCTKDAWKCFPSYCSNGVSIDAVCTLADLTCWDSVGARPVLPRVECVPPQLQIDLQKYKAVTITNYNTMLQNQKEMDSQLPYYSGTTSLQLFQLSSQYSKQVALMKIYFDKASNSSITVTDYSEVKAIVQAANAVLDRYDAIVSTELKMYNQQLQLQQQLDYQKRLQQIEMQNQQNAQQQAEHDAMCQRISINCAIKGSFLCNDLARAGCN